MSVVFVTRSLRPYFYAHTITIPTAYPLLQPIRKPDVSGRLTKWAMELSKFHIEIILAKAIKGQAVADFVAELTP